MSDVLLYQAANTLEAQMIVDVLSQTGITAHVQGAYLQGGIGELQALGVVRVMVDTQDYSRAREVTEQWDATPASAADESSAASSVKSARVLWGVLIGAAAAIVWLMFISA
ncbi:putative signal transducing protein [Gilvimarinus polysaccharolyticus]|uniref:putative signal transducing protein n=1 Tax=Gilvimarinus polysaccharolyticus TaxID=863921 RepID=UPI00067356BC|nr:DUF2007 domain-containing protein [Gilvimarinus polysaccharolyticus]